MTNLPTPNQIFTEEYGQSKNFITPNRQQLQWLVKDCPGLVYELSTGEGIFKGINLGNNLLYGVTIVKYNEDKTIERMHDSSKCCHSMDEVKTHLKKVKSEFKNGRV